MIKMAKYYLPSFVDKVMAEIEPGTEFNPSWHHLNLCLVLTGMLSGQVSPRLIYNTPPRSLKSVIGAISFPAFALGQDPSLSFIVVCYSEKLAEEHLQNIRKCMNADWYKQLFPNTKITSQTANKIKTSKGGSIRIASLKSSLTGFGADMIILDDLTKAQEAYSPIARENVINWFRRVLVSRLNNPNTGRIALICQRIHENDLSGYLLREHSNWEQIKIPVFAQTTKRYPILTPDGPGHHLVLAGDLLDPSRWNEATIHQLRMDLGEHGFSAQYQQEPTPEEGLMFRQSWLHFFDEFYRDDYPTEVVTMSCDTAYTTGQQSNYSVFCIWHYSRGKHFLERVIRERWDTPELIENLLTTAQRYRVDRVLIERMAHIDGLRREIIRGLEGIEVKFIQPTGSKEDRFSSATLPFSRQAVMLPKEAPWLNNYLEELLSFPHATFSDQVDATSLYLNDAQRYFSEGVSFSRRNGRLMRTPQRPRGSASFYSDSTLQPGFGRAYGTSSGYRLF